MCDTLCMGKAKVQKPISKQEKKVKKEKSKVIITHLVPLTEITTDDFGPYIFLFLFGFWQLALLRTIAICSGVVG